jgi:hypothetical protein
VFCRRACKILVSGWYHPVCDTLATQRLNCTVVCLLKVLKSELIFGLADGYNMKFESVIITSFIDGLWRFTVLFHFLLHVCVCVNSIISDFSETSLLSVTWLNLFCHYILLPVILLCFRVSKWEDIYIGSNRRSSTWLR